MPAAPNGIFPRNGVIPAEAAPGALSNPNATCQELFYAARCNPRADVQSMNTIISEIVNVSNQSGLTYDCSRLDNLYRAVIETFNDSLFGCLDRQFPAAGNPCSIQYLVLTVDNEGCRRISRYVEGSNRLTCANLSSVWPIPTTIRRFPTDPSALASYYSAAGLYTERDSPNMAKLNAGKLLQMTVNVPCDNLKIRLDGNFQVAFDSAALDGTGAVVYRVDGQFITAPLQSIVFPFALANNYSNQVAAMDPQYSITLNQGPHLIEAYWVRRFEDSAGAQAIISVTSESLTSSTNICASVVIG